VDNLQTRHVTATLEALLFAAALKPLMGEANPLGGYGTTYFAQLLATRLEDRDR